MNQMDEKNNFQVMKDLQGYFKDGERKLIYNAAQTSRDKALIRLLWVTGRRISEILNIRIYEIDFNLNQITIHVGKKTRKEQGVRVKFDKLSLSYIDDFTKKLLLYHIQNEGLKVQDYLFKSSWKDNKPLSRQRAFEIIKSICIKAGISKVGNSPPHPHHFRHTFAVDMARKMKRPEDVRKLQLALDHSNLAVTEQYLKFSNEEMRDLVNQVGE